VTGLTSMLDTNRIASTRGVAALGGTHRQQCEAADSEDRRARSSP